MEKVNKSLERASQEYIKLLSYVVDLPPGTMLKYDDIERDLGIKMDLYNKQKLRKSILRSGREYTVFPNMGYKLADVSDVPDVIGNRLQAIDSRVRRAEKAHRVIQANFYAELPEEQKAGITFLGVVFATIRNESDKGKRQMFLSPAEREKRLQLKSGNPINVIDPV